MYHFIRNCEIFCRQTNRTKTKCLKDFENPVCILWIRAHKNIYVSCIPWSSVIREGVCAYYKIINFVNAE